MGGKKQKDQVELGPVELIILAASAIALIYWVFLPIWSFMGDVVKVLGGR